MMIRFQKINGEFDDVLKRSGERYDFYECKFYDSSMTKDECDLEKKQLEQIRGFRLSEIGFVCTSGFIFSATEEYVLINGDMLFGNQ